MTQVVVYCIFLLPEPIRLLIYSLMTYADLRTLRRVSKYFSMDAHRIRIERFVTPELFKLREKIRNYVYPMTVLYPPKKATFMETDKCLFVFAIYLLDVFQDIAQCKHRFTFAEMRLIAREMIETIAETVTQLTSNDKNIRLYWEKFIGRQAFRYDRDGQRTAYLRTIPIERNIVNGYEERLKQMVSFCEDF